MHRTRDLLTWIAELDSSLTNHRYLIVASSQVPNDEIKGLLALGNKVFATGTAIKQRDVIEFGWPRSANAMFRLAAEWVASNNAGHWLWLESDALPLRSGWLNELDSEYRCGSKPFCGTIHEHPMKHFNGVMIYCQNVKHANPFMSADTDRPWDLVRPEITLAKGFNTPLIQRLLADPKTNTPMTFPDRQSMSVIRPECVLFHGCKDGTLLARLRERTQTPLPKPRPVPKLLKKTKLAIVLPFCSKDAAVALNTLKWILELNDGKKHEAVVVLSYDLLTSVEAVEEIALQAKKTFRRVVTTSYEAPLPGQLPQTMAFRHAALFMAEQMKLSWLWMEPDLIPIRRRWLEVLQREYWFYPQPFMGSIVAGKGHCNGTAIYPANAPDYIPGAMRMLWTAWDTAMKGEMLAYCHDAGHLMQHVWGVVNGKFHPFGGQAPNFDENPDLIKQIDERAFIFHRSKDGSLINRLRASALPSLQPSVTPVKTQSVNTEIMIVSYHRDVHWLKYCLASIKKFATGFSGVTILVPTADLPVFEWISTEHPKMLLLDYHNPTDSRLWHVAHQLQKCKAEQWCPNADFICHVDSDCIFTEAVTPDFYFDNGKPILWIQEFPSNNPGPWKAPTEKALGRPVKYDTMRHHPAVHYRTLYPDARSIVEKVHGVPFDDYIMSCPIEHKRLTTSWNFSEFEVLGNVALMHHWKDKYSFVDLGFIPRPREVLTQFWSNSPPEKEQQIPSTNQRCVPSEMIAMVLA